MLIMAEAPPEESFLVVHHHISFLYAFCPLLIVMRASYPCSLPRFKAFALTGTIQALDFQYFHTYTDLINRTVGGGTVPFTFGGLEVKVLLAIISRMTFFVILEPAR